jgi:hypothetical protein
MTKENVNLANLAKKLDSRLPTIETILSFTSLTGLALRSLSIPLGGIVLAISLSTLALVYYLIAFRSSIDTKTPAMKKFLDKLFFWGLSISIIGILFCLQNYSGFHTMISIGCSTLLILIIFSVLKKQDVGRRLIFRTIIIAVIGFSLYFTPKEKLLELRIIPSIEMTSNQ